MRRAVRAALAAGVGLLVSGPFSAKEPKEPHKEFELRLPDREWSLVLDLPGFDLEEKDTRPDDLGVVKQMLNESTGVVVSAFIEASPESDSVRACKEQYWERMSRSPFQMADVREEARSDMLLVHWRIPKQRRAPLDQQNTNAYLYRDGACIDVHVSKVNLQPQDEALFDAVIRGIRYAEPEGDRKTVQKREKELREATLENDLKATDRLLADDWTNTAPDGTVTDKATLLRTLKDFKFESIQDEDVRIRIDGDRATVTGSSVRVLSGPDGQPVTRRVRFTRVWEKQKKEWRAVAARSSALAEPERPL